ncbi:hypothetical protein EV2_020016 [Malus domestica]
MESPRIAMKVIITLFCSCMVWKTEFPAIFNFGDSNSDTGGLASSLLEPPPPYGETFLRRSARRFSDGRLIIDFLGMYLVIS